MISIKSLNKYFNKNKNNEIHVINDISLDLPDKGIVSIFGKSGCGKTTLLNTIGGLDNFKDGEILINGENIKKNTDDIRNKYIGYIFQNYNLNNLENCYNNVADALRLCGITDENIIKERVTYALEVVGMDKFALRKPDTLSGGQMQRIAIARAIVKNPKIILADEPTGNLDESNTIMIMDLLKKISLNHLVLLVTHEENIVFNYCDKVITLSDGKVVNIKDNLSKEDYHVRDKNTLYLGEYDKKEIKNDNVNIDYYTNSLNDTNINIKLINNNGKIYLKVLDNKIKIIDSQSEIKLVDSKFEDLHKEEKKEYVKSIENLSDIDYSDKNIKLGRLFTLKKSIISGYLVNFTNKKKGNKFLKRVMFLFACVLVFMFAVFGTSFGSIIEAKKSYNHNVFLVYTPSYTYSNKLKEAYLNNNAGIEYMSLYLGDKDGRKSLTFGLSNFETFNNDYDSTISTIVTLLPISLVKDAKLICGKSSGLEKNEIVLSKASADKLLESSCYSFISDYKDLLGLKSTSSYYYYRTESETSYIIVGIVDVDEIAGYVDLSFNNDNLISTIGYNVRRASDYNISLNDNETYILRTEDDTTSYKNEVIINSKTYTLKDKYTIYYDYEDYALNHGITYDNYFDSLHLEGVDKYEYYDEHYFDYCDYYISCLDQFIKDKFNYYDKDIHSWLYSYLGKEDIKFYYLDSIDVDTYYKAILYKKDNGTYPDTSNLDTLLLPYEDYSITEIIINMENTYLDSFNVYNSSHSYSESEFEGLVYLLNDNEFDSLALSYGLNSKGVIGSNNYYLSNSEENTSSISLFTIIYSNDVEKTIKYLNDNFSDLENLESYYDYNIVTPDTVYSEIIKSNRTKIISNLIAIGVVFIMMSICMYFIMRSSLMIRIKEVGIYRAIGVTKKNLVFKFLIESLVLSVLTIFISYLICSGIIYIWLGSNSIMKSLFYYPWWYALIVLVLLFLISTVCGIIPIISLLRKKPSQILSKYDI